MESTIILNFAINIFSSLHYSMISLFLGRKGKETRWSQVTSFKFSRRYSGIRPVKLTSHCVQITNCNYASKTPWVEINFRKHLKGLLISAVSILKFNSKPADMTTIHWIMFKLITIFGFVVGGGERKQVLSSPTSSSPNRLSPFPYERPNTSVFSNKTTNSMVEHYTPTARVTLMHPISGIFPCKLVFHLVLMMLQGLK